MTRAIVILGLALALGLAWLCGGCCSCPVPPPPDMTALDTASCYVEGEDCSGVNPCCDPRAVCIAFQIPAVCCTTMVPVPCGDGGSCCPNRPDM